MTVDCTNYRNCFQIAADPANKGVTLSPEVAFEKIVAKSYRSGVSSLHALEQEINRAPGAFGFKRFSPFFETFNNKLGQLLDNGLHESDGLFTLPDKIRQFDEIGPQVLTMDHLEVAFIACFIPLVLAIVVFILEIVVGAT